MSAGLARLLMNSTLAQAARQSQRRRVRESESKVHHLTDRRRSIQSKTKSTGTFAFVTGNRHARGLP